MNILVTGSRGFVGKNLSVSLRYRGHNVMECDSETPKEVLFDFIKQSDFIVHLAGINRPVSVEDFYKGNSDFTLELIELIKKAENFCPIIFSSSIQATLKNDYGLSKKAAEDFLFTFQKETGNLTYIFRLSNLFGKWSKPNYNSVVATFCYNATHNIPLVVSDPRAEIPLMYIDDLVEEFCLLIDGKKHFDSTKINEISPIYKVSLGNLAKIISAFKNSRSDFYLPDVSDEFVNKLYATYLSFLEPRDFAYVLNKKEDNRGCFAEFFKTNGYGQVSINITKPGITKGNHFHFTKNEKFLVVSGEAEILFRKIGTDEKIVHRVSGDNLTVVDIPPGYIHSLTNVGVVDLVTVIWANEIFNPGKPDTFPEIV